MASRTVPTATRGASSERKSPRKQPLPGPQQTASPAPRSAPKSADLEPRAKAAKPSTAGVKQSPSAGKRSTPESGSSNKAKASPVASKHAGAGKAGKGSASGKASSGAASGPASGAGARRSRTSHRRQPEPEPEPEPEPVRTRRSASVDPQSAELTFSPAIDARSRALGASYRKRHNLLPHFGGDPTVKTSVAARVREEQQREWTFAPQLNAHSLDLVADGRPSRTQKPVASSEQRVLDSATFHPVVSPEAQRLAARSYRRRKGRAVATDAAIADVFARLALDDAAASKSRAWREALVEYAAESPLYSLASKKSSLVAEARRTLQDALQVAGRASELPLALDRVYTLNGLENPRPPVAAADGDYAPDEATGRAIEALAFAERVAAQARVRCVADFERWLAARDGYDAEVATAVRSKLIGVQADGSGGRRAASAAAGPVRTRRRNRRSGSLSSDSIFSDGDLCGNDDDNDRDRDDDRGGGVQPRAATASAVREQSPVQHLARLSRQSPLFRRHSRHLCDHLSEFHASAEAHALADETFAPVIDENSRALAERQLAARGAAGLAVHERLFLTETHVSLGASGSSGGGGGEAGGDGEDPAGRGRRYAQPIAPVQALALFTAADAPGAALQQRMADKKRLFRAHANKLQSLLHGKAASEAARATGDATSESSGRKQRLPHLVVQPRSSAMRTRLVGDLAALLRQIHILQTELRRCEKALSSAFTAWYRDRYGISPTAYARAAAADEAATAAAERAAAAAAAGSSSPGKRMASLTRAVSPSFVTRTPSLSPVRQRAAARLSAEIASAQTHTPVISDRSRALTANKHVTLDELAAPRDPARNARLVALAEAVAAQREAECTFAPAISDASLALVAKNGYRDARDMVYAAPRPTETREALASEQAAAEAAACTFAPTLTPATRALAEARVAAELAEQFGDDVPPDVSHVTLVPAQLQRYQRKLAAIRADMDRENRFVPAINEHSARVAGARLAVPAHERLFANNIYRRREVARVTEDSAYAEFVGSNAGALKLRRVEEKRAILRALKAQLQQDLVDAGKGLLYGVILAQVGRANEPNRHSVSGDNEVLFEKNRDWMQPVVDELAFLERAIAQADDMLRADFNHWFAATYAHRIDAEGGQA